MSSSKIYEIIICLKIASNFNHHIVITSDVSHIWRHTKCKFELWSFFSDVVMFLNWISWVSQISVYYRNLARGVNWPSATYCNTYKKTKVWISEHFPLKLSWKCTHSQDIPWEIYTFTSKYTISHIYAHVLCLHSICVHMNVCVWVYSSQKRFPVFLFSNCSSIQNRIVLHLPVSPLFSSPISADMSSLIWSVFVKVTLIKFNWFLGD